MIFVPVLHKLDLYNLSLKGIQRSFSKGFSEGKIELLESTLNLKKMIQ